MYEVFQNPSSGDSSSPSVELAQFIDVFSQSPGEDGEKGATIRRDERDEWKSVLV